MMQRIAVLLLLTFAWTGVSAGQSVEHSDTSFVEKNKKEVLKVEQELDHAVLKNATETLSRLLSDEVVWLTPTGEFLTKAQVLADIHPGEFSSKTGDSQLSVYGNTVVVYSTTKAGEEKASKKEMPPKRITDVFVKEGGQWKLIAHGATFVSQP
jgi:ketosteroid isomerase-like protein